MDSVNGCSLLVFHDLLDNLDPTLSLLGVFVCPVLYPPLLGVMWCSLPSGLHCLPAAPGCHCLVSWLIPVAGSHFPMPISCNTRIDFARVCIVLWPCALGHWSPPPARPLQNLRSFSLARRASYLVLSPSWPFPNGGVAFCSYAHSCWPRIYSYRVTCPLWASNSPRIKKIRKHNSWPNYVKTKHLFGYFKDTFRSLRIDFLSTMTSESIGCS